MHGSSPNKVTGTASIHFSRWNRFGAVQRKFSGAPELVEACEGIAPTHCQATTNDSVRRQSADAPKGVGRWREFSCDFAEVLFENEPFAWLYAGTADVKSGPIAIFAQSRRRGDRIKLGLNPNAFDCNRTPETNDIGFHFDGIVGK